MSECCRNCGLELPDECLCTYGDTDCVDWAPGPPAVPSPIVDPATGNLIECRADGLWGGFPDFVTNPVHAMVSRQFDKGITAAGDAIDFSEAVDDTGTFWSGANPTRLTAPVDGLYEFGACAALMASAIGLDFSLELRLNAVTRLMKRLHLITDIALPTSVNIGTEYVLSAGEFVDVFADYNGGAGTEQVFYAPHFSPTAWIMLAVAL